MLKKVTGILLASALCASLAHAVGLEKIASNGSYAPMRPLGSGVYAPGAGSAGKTFVVWAGPQMDVYARAFDHATMAWESPALVRNNNYTGAEAYHNYPVIGQAPDGRMIIIYFNHSFEGYQLRSPSADSLGGTWTNTTILPASEQVGYPTLVTAGSTMYLFYRSKTTNDVYRTLNFIKSNDSGGTWSSPNTIIDTGNAQSDNLDTVYPDEVGYEAARGSIPARIRITWHLAGGAFNDQKRKNVYFAYLYTGDDSMRNAAGVSLGSVIGSDDFADQVNNKILVRSVLPSAAIDKAVDAHIVSRPNFNDGSKPIVGYNIETSGGATAYTAVWNGSAWTSRRMSQAGVELSGRLMDFQFVDNGTLRAIMAHGLTVRGKETTTFGADWSAKWELDISSQTLNGADTLGYVNTVEIPGRKVQALVGTFSNATRDTDYSGRWPVFAITD